MRTKKELQEEFKLSVDQLRRVLTAVGLDTGKTSYTEEEIEKFVRPAVQALYVNEKRVTVEEVEEWAAGVRLSQKKVDTTGYDTLRAEVLDVIEDSMGEIIERDADEIVERLYMQFAKHAGRMRGAAQAFRMRVANRMVENQTFPGEPPRGLGGAPPDDDDTIETEAHEVREDDR